MKNLALFFVLYCGFAQPVVAHQCILDGSTTTAIQAYNSCKADLANGTSGHAAGHAAGDHAAGDHAAGDHTAELARLKAENALLKARLDDVKRRLLGLLGDL